MKNTPQPACFVIFCLFRKYSGITEAVKCSSITKQQRARVNEEFGRRWAAEVTGIFLRGWCELMLLDQRGRFTNALRGTGVFM